ncbi:hypothetical protein GYMLUDRAFT_237486 [Collybiopsis luxurians FD-317 M1]|nr:hypothetical protein GYMLUDRAFT_237486 [Collybiopsis luxurians FD-317 M1]
MSETPYGKDICSYYMKVAGKDNLYRSRACRRAAWPTHKKSCKTTGELRDVSATDRDVHLANQKLSKWINVWRMSLTQWPPWVLNPNAADKDKLATHRKLQRQRCGVNIDSPVGYVEKLLVPAVRYAFSLYITTTAMHDNVKRATFSGQTDLRPQYMYLAREAALPYATFTALVPGNPDTPCTRTEDEPVASELKPSGAVFNLIPSRPMSSNPQPRNILFFGSTGCGKSSIINMLLGRSDAPTSNGAKACTSYDNDYSFVLDGREYRLFDTVGLDQGTAGTVTSNEALSQLYHLLYNLKDGISLLVYCVQGPRCGPTFKRNYSIFYDGFCRKSVPIGLVVTGLEDQEPSMEEWWDQNHGVFMKHEVHFNGHACVTATLGKMKNGEFENQARYDESKKALQDLIVQQCRDRTYDFQKEPETWFALVVKWICRNLHLWVEDQIDQIPLPQPALYDKLRQFLPAKDAREIVGLVEREDGKAKRGTPRASDRQKRR